MQKKTHVDIITRKRTRIYLEMKHLNERRHNRSVFKPFTFIYQIHSLIKNELL